MLDAAGNRIQASDPNGNVTDYTYTGAGLLASILEPDGDGAGPLGRPFTQLAYDGLGRLVTKTNPDGTTRSFAHDDADNLTSLTDELGRTTTYAHDELGRVLTETDAAGNVTTYRHDLLDRLVQITLPGGATYGWGYDARDRLVSVTEPGGSTGFTWSNFDNLTSVIDALGGVTSFAHDADGRMTQMTRPDPDGAGPLEAGVYTYAVDARQSRIDRPHWRG